MGRRPRPESAGAVAYPIARRRPRNPELVNHRVVLNRSDPALTRLHVVYGSNNKVLAIEGQTLRGYIGATAATYTSWASSGLNTKATHTQKRSA